MPAVTVDDITKLPHIPLPDPTATQGRPVVSVTTAPHGLEGEGFPVRRAFAGADPSLLDPFVHMDQMGEVEYAPGEPKGTPWHPHRGFETVTYMIDGTFQHQDSNGGGGLITNGDTQWMTAGRGILHIERPPETLIASGGLFHGFQLWVNLPAAQKWEAPRYQDIRAANVELITSYDGGTLLRVIAGEVGGYQGPGVTHTPIALAHATLSAGARLVLPWRRDFNALAYVLSGRGTVGPDARLIVGGQLATFGEGDVISISADETQESRSPFLDVLLLGGRPIREPVAWYGPFVMNTHAEIAQALSDYKEGKLGTIPANHIGD
jgi:redox-sensitive bicupin YhaK (pirin superfamily)